MTRVDKWRRLTTAMDLAALRGDEAAWTAAFNARERLGIGLARHPELATWLSPHRCKCCLRLVEGGVCKDGLGRAA